MSEIWLYDADAAAAKLSTTKRRIHELRRSGKLAAVQDGRHFKFTHTELQRYIDSLQPYDPRVDYTPGAGNYLAKSS